MNAKVRTTILVITLCALFVAGCPKNSSTVRMDQNAKMATDLQMLQLKKELDKKWENPPALYRMGQLYQSQGDLSKAEWYYNLALGFDPSYRDVQASLVKLQLDKGDKPKADLLANGYITQTVSMPEQILSLGGAFEKQGLDEYAFRCYAEALKATPDSWQVNRQLGYYYLHKNKKDLAKEYFVRSFQLNSNQPDVAGELGRLGISVRIPEAAPKPSTAPVTKP